MTLLKKDKTTHYEVPVGIYEIIRTQDGHLRDIVIKAIKIPKKYELTDADIQRIIDQITISSSYTWTIQTGESSEEINNNETLIIAEGDNITLSLVNGTLTIDAIIPEQPILTEIIEFVFENVVAGTARTWTLCLKAPFAFTITSGVFRSDGTLTSVSITINGTVVTGLSSLTVDTNKTESTATAGNIVAIDDEIKIAIGTGYAEQPTLIEGELRIQRS